jgi:hypothetical protein
MAAPTSGQGASDVSAAAACNTVRYGGKGYVLFRQGGVKCKFAKRWVKRLHNSGGQNKPAGWKCSSGTKYKTGGQCTKGSKAFGWHPGD